MLLFQSDITGGLLFMAHPCRSPSMRAARAKLKSCKDDEANQTFELTAGHVAQVVPGRVSPSAPRGAETVPKVRVQVVADGALRDAP